MFVGFLLIACFVVYRLRYSVVLFVLIVGGWVDCDCGAEWFWLLDFVVFVLGLRCVICGW